MEFRRRKESQLKTVAKMELRCMRKLTPIQINAVGLEPEWSDQELARLQRVDGDTSIRARHKQDTYKLEQTPTITVIWTSLATAVLSRWSFASRSICNPARRTKEEIKGFGLPRKLN